jgi:hypothetical protein
MDHQPLADKIANLAPGELRHASAGQRQRFDEQTEFGALFAGGMDKESDRRLGQNDVARRRSFGQGSQAGTETGHKLDTLSASDS